MKKQPSRLSQSTEGRLGGGVGGERRGGEARYLCDILFSFSSNIYPEVELLEHMVILFLLFSIVAILIYNSVSSF